MPTHHYRIALRWTGNTGRGTAAHNAYSRAHQVSAGDKPPIAGSSDPSFRGDAARWNPEELLLASLSGCHQLWYLGLCAQHGVVVVGYEDAAEGWMEEQVDGAGQFVRAVLRPRVTLAPDGDAALARALHAAAHDKCFIARSVRFAVEVEPEEHRAGDERVTGQAGGYGLATKRLAWMAAALILAALPAAAQPAHDMGDMPAMHHAPAPAAGAQAPASREFQAEMAKMHAAMAVPSTGDADKDFVAGMLPHHQGAIEMARTELRYGHDPVLRKLAQQIILAQDREIALMRRWQAGAGAH